MTAIRFDSVSFGYSPAHPVLSNISLEIPAGSCALLLGYNGAGKSTLLKLLNGINQPLAGDVTINGLNTKQASTSRLAREISVTFQHPANQIFESTVEREIAFGPNNIGLHNAASLVQEAAEMFGLPHLLRHHPYDLSPAQRKLLTVASAVAMQTPGLAFDEPSAGLSEPERKLLLHALADLKRAGKTLLIITHDLDLFLPFADRILLLSDGQIQFNGQPEHFIAQQRSFRRLGAELPLSMRLDRLVKDYGGAKNPSRA